MKKLIMIIILFSIIPLSNVYSATEYDEEQDELIDNNTDNIDNNTDSINDNTDSINDNVENISTNTTNISTNTSNISSNDTDIATINEGIGDRQYGTYYITDGESVTSSLNSLDQQTFANSQKLDDHEGRINDLEETEINLVGEVQFIRKKNHTVSAYTKYDIRHSKVAEVGLRFTVKLGKSWEEKEIEKMQVKMDKLEKMILK